MQSIRWRDMCLLYRENRCVTEILTGRDEKTSAGHFVAAAPESLNVRLAAAHTYTPQPIVIFTSMTSGLDPSRCEHLGVEVFHPFCLKHAKLSRTPNLTGRKSSSSRWLERTPVSYFWCRFRTGVEAAACRSGSTSLATIYVAQQPQLVCLPPNYFVYIYTRCSR